MVIRKPPPAFLLDVPNLRSVGSHHAASSKLKHAYSPPFHPHDSSSPHSQSNDAFWQRGQKFSNGVRHSGGNPAHLQRRRCRHSPASLW